MFYQPSFICKSIRATLSPQIHENSPGPARWRPIADSFRRFPDKLFVRFEQTQKQSCRAHQGLSADLNWTLIWWTTLDCSDSDDASRTIATIYLVHSVNLPRSRKLGWLICAGNSKEHDTGVVRRLIWIIQNLIHLALSLTVLFNFNS